MIVAIISTMTVCLTACGGGNPASSENKDVDTYAFSASSLGAMMSVTNANGASIAEATEPSILQGFYEKINGYLAMVETYLSTDPVQYEESTSTKDGYEKMIKITTKDLEGNEAVYYLHFNETQLQGDEDGDDQKEICTRIDGVIVVGEAEFKISGETEVEEGEHEVTIKAYFNANDENDYMEMSQEIEQNEVSYEITMVKNGIVTLDYELSKEVDEQGNTEISFEKKTNIGNVQIKQELSFTRMTNPDGSTFLKMESKLNGFEVEADIYIEKDAETGKVSYKFHVDGKIVFTGEKTQPTEKVA